MHIGFSGTQEGMTHKQLMVVTELMSTNLKRYSTSHSGDCIGADHDFLMIVKSLGLYVVGHPPVKKNKRAFDFYDEIREAKDYLDRNHDIVDESNFMLFTPKEFEEILRSGTWATVRYTKAQKKPGIIVYPDGTKEYIGHDC